MNRDGLKAGIANRGWGVPLPSWGASEKFIKLTKSRLFSVKFTSIFFQNDVNDIKMEFFFEVGLSVEPLDPPPKSPPGPPWRPVHWRSLLKGVFQTPLESKSFENLHPRKTEKQPSLKSGAERQLGTKFNSK